MASSGGSQSFFPEMMCPFHSDGTGENMSHSLSSNEMGKWSLLCPEVAQSPALMKETVTCRDAMGLNFPIDILPHTSFINLGLFWGPDSLLCVKALWMCEGFSPAKFLVSDTWIYFHLCPVMFVKQWMICF